MIPKRGNEERPVLRVLTKNLRDLDVRVLALNDFYREGLV